VTLLDAYALVAFLADEPAAEQVESLLRTGDTTILVVNLAEAIDVTRRVHRFAAEEVRRCVEPLVLGGKLAVVASAESDGWRAAEIRATHHRRKRRPLSLADCFLLAHAEVGGGAIATPDQHVQAVARDLGVDVVQLPTR
jgi:predicted nucleic acid-binding protein